MMGKISKFIMSSIGRVINLIRVKPIRKGRVVCKPDYSKRYKVPFVTDIMVMADCQVCGITYWARSLKSLKECINECSDCVGHMLVQDDKDEVL
jgi:hypothetical protein